MGRNQVSNNATTLIGTWYEHEVPFQTARLSRPAPASRIRGGRFKADGSPTARTNAS